jgi:putative two-component system response regulator
MNQINDHIPPLAAPVGCILVVDDDKKSQRLFLDLLKAQGYSVTLADDGEQALEKAFANPPDVILLDIMMPNMDGYEVCRNLRLDPILAEVAIIMVTSLDDRAARLRGLEAGADDFITKPVDIIELLTRVRNVIQLNRYRKLLQERTKAQRAQAEIMSSCEATLAAWVRILERDGRVVLGQCDGVTQWALRLAKSAGMTNGDLGAVRWSILLHAIGAMAVPTALRGREDLSPEEEEQVHEQEAWIIEALAPVTALREALGIVARRHEHWDGSGRPDGLKGEAIPLAARVLAVALAWETNQTHAFSTTAARLAVLKAQAGHRFDPRLVEALERTVGRREATMNAASVPVEAPLPPRSLLQRFSLATTGVRAQFAVALALIAVIPMLIVICLCVTGWLGIEANLSQLGPAVLLVLPFVALGYWILAKYPINVTRLRHYMESLAQGVLPDQVALVTGEDDLAAIELLMRKVVKQTEKRAHTIESQSGALLAAERQRVMIQSLGTACHHLGQPATVITGYLEMTQRMALPAEAQLMLEQCRLAAADVADILARLQRLTVYRSEPYLLQTETAPSSHDSSQLIKI